MQRRKRIAFIVDSIESEYTQKILQGIQTYLADKPYDLLVFPIAFIGLENGTYDYQNRSVTAHITRENIDGIILMTGPQLNYTTPEYIHSFLNSFAPIPAVNIAYPFKDIDSVVPTAKKSMKTLVNHLIHKHNRKRIALMAVGTDSHEAVERESVFRETLKENGIEYDENLTMIAYFSYECALKALREHKEKYGYDFDAVVALNDDMAFACVDTFRNEGIRIPEDIIVTGFDDEVRSYCGNPTLTTINQNIEGQGAAAAEIIIERLEGKKTDRLRYIDSTPIFRQSCGCVTGTSVVGKGVDENGNLIESKINGYASYGVAEWYNQRNQFISVIQLYSTMQFDMPMESFRGHINNDLGAMGINAAAVCLFEKPINTDRFEYFYLPQKASVIAAFDKKAGTLLDNNSDPLVFNPNEGMLPEGVISSFNGMFVMTLYRSSLIFGYIVFRPGPYDVTVYNMICKILSNSISSALNMTESEKEKRNLEKKAVEAKQISVTDEMTGLLNRRGFMNLGQKTLEISEEREQGGMVLFGDLDGLKKINDTYGHANGDKAIKAEAKILRSAFRESDVIGRLGGDEYAIVAPGLKESKVSRILKWIEDECNKWNSESGEEFKLSISIGVAAFEPAKGPYQIETLLKTADAALYEEKKRKKTLRVD